VRSLAITEALAKVRTGPPLDDEEDYEMDVWAGVIPLRLVANAPIDDPQQDAKAAVPWYAVDYQRPTAASSGSKTKG
jgi:hypothetical protein